MKPARPASRACREGGDLLTAPLVIRARMRLSGTRSAGRQAPRCAGTAGAAVEPARNVHLTTLENVLTCRFTGTSTHSHRKAWWSTAKSPCTERGGKSAPSKTARVSLFGTEARRTHQSLRLRKIHETALTCRHRRIGARMESRVCPARLKRPSHEILYFH